MQSVDSIFVSCTLAEQAAAVREMKGVMFCGMLIILGFQIWDS